MYELDEILGNIDEGQNITLDMLGWNKVREAYETNFGSFDHATILTIIKRNKKGLWQVAVIKNKKVKPLLGSKRTIIFEDETCPDRSNALYKLNDFFRKNSSTLKLEHSKRPH